MKGTSQTPGTKMSWLVDLAGRAEDFLNKVDQGAASALTKHSSHSSSSGALDPLEPDLTPYSEPRHSYTGHETHGFISAAAENIKRSNASVLAGTANVSGTTLLGSAVSSSAAKASSNFVRPKRPEVDDDLLFDFLNSSDPPQSDKKEARRDTVVRTTGLAEGSAQGQATVPSAPATPPSTRALSRTSSLGSLTASTHSTKTENDYARDGSQGTNLVDSESERCLFYFRILSLYLTLPHILFNFFPSTLTPTPLRELRFRPGSSSRCSSLGGVELGPGRAAQSGGVWSAFGEPAFAQ